MKNGSLAWWSIGAVVLTGFLIGTGCASSEVALEFSIYQQRQVYEESIYGEPPQFAIWLENMESNEVQTVVVTRRTATGVFEGRAAVPVSLPAWIVAFREETGRDDFPSPRRPADNVDAISMPTPVVDEIVASINVQEGTQWYYYVEVNVSGDFNSSFPAFFPDGSLDRYGNGQPSIIYRGEITAQPGRQSTPELIGRTEQLFFSEEIIPDLSGIESARDLFSRIQVVCKIGSN
jgi:hypothetical protein